MTLEPPVYPTIGAWAEAHGIARSTAYELIKSGKGPRLLTVGRRKLVTAEAAQEWRERYTEGEAA